MYEFLKSFLTTFKKMFGSNPLSLSPTSTNSQNSLYDRLMYDMSDLNQCKWWFICTQQLHLFCNNIIFIWKRLSWFSHFITCVSKIKMWSDFFSLHDSTSSGGGSLSGGNGYSIREAETSHAKRESRQKNEYIFILVLLITKVWSK